MKRTALTASAAVLLLPLSACGSSAEAGSGSTITVTVGYQSKTINTVTAGTLLRSLGSFEKQLDSLHDGHTYKVDWQDYATGAPITAQMTAGKIDIGSMGDFPLLLNAARGKQLGRSTRLVSVTGYNLRGGLNTVVTAPDSKLSTLRDLKGKKVSTSIGSAADGTLVRALQRAGIDPDKDISKLNQQPAVGASALTSGSVDALSQFVAWPGLLAYQGKAKALYDGAQLARALADSPRAVLMDEPFGALDAQTRSGMQDLLVEVLRGTGATVVFVTHDVDEALFLGDRVALLGSGRVAAVRDVPGPRDRGAVDDPARVALRRDVLTSLGS
ncbi:hypothetical protein GCM10010339_74760 [Streptomyces alanosinicus]|uniref:ABC transporter domain-containing protein n=1 Tax=Streptomyces alanosinicus TaxID=68171 RepID=A0A918YQ04_9ACTN|nr:ABC transporter substrate-binding protein [Streptomyces alanosinicus]GHE12223.1 hypothetical protein GCM10010339_74760 [Streptomyces alanosinicus]